MTVSIPTPGSPGAATPRAGDVLVVASHLPDLEGARTWLDERLQGTVRELSVRTKVVGVGSAVAAAATARGILAIGPRVVVLVGTCGIYPGAPERRPLDLVVASHAGLLDHAVVAARARFPGPLQTTLDCPPLLATAVQACHPRGLVAPVASPLSETTDDALASTVAPSTGFVAENLEAFGVASACRAAGVPFVAALGVTHVVGAAGRHDFAQFHRDAAIGATNAVAAWLHRGAPGLPHG